MRTLWDHTDYLTCVEYWKRGVKVTPGEFNPLRNKPKAATAMESLNHETCPHMYYRGASDGDR